MRCSQMLGVAKENRLSAFMDRRMSSLSIKYRDSLEWCLGNRIKVLSSALIIFAVSLSLPVGMRKVVVPPQFQSRFVVTIQHSLGSSINMTDQIFSKAETIAKSRPEVESYFSMIGGVRGGTINQGNLMINLKSSDTVSRLKIVKYTDNAGQRNDISVSLMKDFNRERAITLSANVAPGISVYGRA